MLEFPGARFFRRPKFIIGILIILYFVGLIGHIVPVTYPLLILITPYFLLISGICVVWPAIASASWVFRFWFFSAWLVTFILEVVGVSTGAIFGSYNYGTVLGANIMGVPPLIGFNWVVVVLGALSLVRKLPLHPFFVILFSAILCTIFDFIMEPTAIANMYWIWSGNTIPLQNYLAWFIIALVMAASGFAVFKTEKHIFTSSENLLSAYFIIQLAFFAFQDIIRLIGKIPV